MIVYLDSSILARSYLVDEAGHQDAVALLNDPSLTRVTGIWTRIEVSGALLRAAQSGRTKSSEKDLIGLLDSDLGPSGPVAEVQAPHDDVEHEALLLVRRYALRALDSWHLAVAVLTVPILAEPEKEEIAFASRDATQGAIAEQLGFKLI